MTDFPFTGLNIALATPFDADGKIHYGQLEDSIERHLDAGIKSFLLSSGTGLHVYLSRQEADDLIERGSKIINGRAKIIAHTSALLVEDVVDRTRHAANCGADGVMVLPPFFEGPTSDDDVFAFYEAVGEGGLPIIGYNIPINTGITITPDLFRRLVQIPNFVSVKDSSADMVAQSDLISTGLPVINGADPLQPYALYAGAAGVIWGGANIASKACNDFVEAALAGDWTKARELWRSLEPLMSHIWKGDYVPSVYAASEMAGNPIGAPRRPFKALAEDELPALKSLVEGLPSGRPRDVNEQGSSTHTDGRS